jgi:hypothetical protein
MSKPTVRIYAVTTHQSPSDIVAYYQRTYPRYNWHSEVYFSGHASVGSGTDLVGKSSWMSVDVYVGSAPYVPTYPTVTLKSAPSGSSTYVTVYVSGNQGK